MFRKKHCFQKLTFDRAFKLTTIWLIFLVCLAVSNGFGQEKIAFNFEKREILKPISIPEKSISMTVSPDNSAISTLFDNFSVNLQTANDSLSGAVFAGFFVPVKTTKESKFITYTQQLRGMITKDANTKVLIILNLNGDSTIIEYPFGKKFEGELFKDFPRKVKNLKLNSYLATFGIIVERRDVKNIGFVQIDSFDLTIK